MKSNKQKFRPIFYIFWAVVMIVLILTTTNENKTPEPGIQVVYTISSDNDNAWAGITYLGRNGAKFGDENLWQLPSTRTVYLDAGDLASIKATLWGSGDLHCTIDLVDTPRWRTAEAAGKNASVECSGIVGRK